MYSFQIVQFRTAGVITHDHVWVGHDHFSAVPLADIIACRPHPAGQRKLPQERDVVAVDQNNRWPVIVFRERERETIEYGAV